MICGFSGTARLCGTRVLRRIHHRGTEHAPGLVLALDHMKGAQCEGLAFRAKPEAHEQTLSYLRDRELISSAYLEKRLEIDLRDGRRVNAVTYVIDPDHVQYCQIDLDEQARIIASAVGGRGPNTEYLYNTAGHLIELGIEDDDLSWLVREVRAMTAD